MAKKENKLIRKQELDRFFGDMGNLRERARQSVELSPMERSTAIFLIKDFLGMTLKEFCLETDNKYQMFYDALKGKREFTYEMQEEIRVLVINTLIGTRVTIKI